MTLQDLQAQIGHRIRDLRHDYGISQKQLATLTGLAVPALSRIENGKRDVKLSTLVRIAEALRVDVGALVASEKAQSAPTTGDAVVQAYDLGEDD